MELLFVAKDGRARLRLVKTGKKVGAEVEIASGVNAGEQVVSANAANLADGQPILVK
jgi:hypothetical protein